MSETYKQMDIFDFIEEPQTMLQQLFGKVNNPVYRCVNCLCNYCANNVEELYCKVKPGEMQNACFVCDECYEYSADCRHKIQRKENCGNFMMSDYGAKRNRNKLKIVKS